MLDSIRTYAYDRRQGMIRNAAFAGGLYLARRYVKDRLEEVKDRLEQERMARESLKRRFSQTQEDVSYTVMALIPTLADQVLREMDVEAITQELQTRCRERQTTRNLLLIPHPQRPSSLSSSIDIVYDHEVRSDIGSLAVSATFTSGEGTGVPNEAESSRTPPEPQDLQPSVVHRAEAVLRTNSHTVSQETPSADELAMSESILSLSAASDSSDSRTKAELWNEVKMLTFTRTLTTLYSTTLLCLLTTIQLTVLARLKYVASVCQLEREEKIQGLVESQLSMSNLLFGGGSSLEELLSGSMSGLSGAQEEMVSTKDPGEIDEETESKYLTMSWWLLHVGWKDVGERVRRGVEEALDGVSLKSRLAHIDLHRLVNDVRRRVEHEITFEVNERGTTFLSSVLPPTPETVQHVLTQNGFPSLPHLQCETADSTRDAPSDAAPHPSTQPPHDNHSSPAAPVPSLPACLISIIRETRLILASLDFNRVLSVALDCATDVFLSGLSKNVFSGLNNDRSSLVPGEDVRIRLASLLPAVARWSQLALNGLPNELVDNLLDLREVKCLSAIVFARFEETLR